MSNILTTRNIVGVTYKLDEILTPDQQAEVLTDIIERLAVKEFTFSSYEQINNALKNGQIVEGQFVQLIVNPLDIPTIVVTKYRNVNRNI